MGQKQEEKSLIGRISPNWCLIFILFLAILGTYYESLSYPFSNLDDTNYIRDNPYIRDLSWDGIYKIFSQPIVANYFPLQILTYALDYQVWHIQPFGYHLHNVILHFLNAVLLFLLLEKLFSNLWVSFFAALLFGLHPVNVESVTWVAERKNVLSLALMLSSFLAYLYYVEAQRPTERKGFYLLAFFLFLLALLAKVSAVVLPLLFILYDLCFQKRKKWEMARDKIPFFVLALLFSVLTVWIYQSGKYLAGYYGGSLYTTFLAMMNVFVEYIIYLIVPVYLDHLYWTPIPETILERQVLLSLAAIFLLALLAWWSFRRGRVFFFWFGWFFISLLPVLNIVPIVILRADRYMYLPAIGFFYLVSLGLWKTSRRGYRPMRFPVFLFCSLLVAGTYAFLTIERNQLWKDPIIFWKESLRKFPQSLYPYRSIGYTYVDRGKYDLAISYFQAGLQHHPNDVDLLNGLAMAHKSKKDLKKAEELLIQAIRLHPKDSVTYNNLGRVYYQKGEIGKARSCLQKALEMDPKSAPACTNLGVIFCSVGQWEEALRLFEKSIEISPCSIEPYLNLALVYEKKRLLEKAESCLKRGLDYMPESHAALSMLARILFEQGKFPEGKHYLNQAYRINPNDGDTKYLLSLFAQGEANHTFKNAMKTTSLFQITAMEPFADKRQGHRNP
jgi:tetratricopeptide (TPR) repeat protein